MKLLKTVEEARDYSMLAGAMEAQVGLVPTMGYLHPGHASLIKRAVAENHRAVVSIFVNPAQFGPSEDLDSYPRDLDRDLELCQSLGAHGVFFPDPKDMYPKGFSTFVEVESLSDHLCGQSRPTHFRGVCTVVIKLLHLFQPRRAYFGLKDAQQFFILSRMVRDLNMGLELVPCPIVREEDGLAMSSRNANLSPEERKAAKVLHLALEKARELLFKGEREASVLTQAMRDIISAEAMARLDYAQVVSAESLSPVERVEGQVLVALAAFISKTRLIDNFIFSQEKDQ
jgi:pantoate--beta-alanine ligase